MDNNSRETLRRVTQNDPSLTELRLADNHYNVDGNFYSDNNEGYSTLGAAFANNTHVEKLRVRLSDDLLLGVTNRGFYDGLKAYSSISNLELSQPYGRNINYRQNIAGGAGQEILKVYQENNSQLTVLKIINANLQSGGDHVVADTLRRCRNLRKVTLHSCNITGEQPMPIVDAIRGHRMLETLDLYGNNIGNAGCDAIAALLADPDCNLSYLSLSNNPIHDEGATAIANSLINNNKLQRLYLYSNPIDQIIQEVFSNVLCNVSNINSLYASNHTLRTLTLRARQGQQLQSLIRLNEDTNKSHVAMKKILRHYPNINMEPLFQWDAEGEQTLKALPHIINWFEGARIAVAADDEEFDIEGRKLSAIFQFSKAMPLLLEGISHMNVDNKKRKRED